MNDFVIKNTLILYDYSDSFYANWVKVYELENGKFFKEATDSRNGLIQISGFDVQNMIERSMNR